MAAFGPSGERAMKILGIAIAVVWLVTILTVLAAVQ